MSESESFSATRIAVVATSIGFEQKFSMRRRSRILVDYSWGILDRSTGPYSVARSHQGARPGLCLNYFAAAASANVTCARIRTYGSCNRAARAHWGQGPARRSQKRSADSR